MKQIKEQVKEQLMQLAINCTFEPFAACHAMLGVGAKGIDSNKCDGGKWHRCIAVMLEHCVKESRSILKESNPVCQPIESACWLENSTLWLYEQQKPSKPACIHVAKAIALGMGLASAVLPNVLAEI